MQNFPYTVVLVNTSTYISHHPTVSPAELPVDIVTQPRMVPTAPKAAYEAVCCEQKNKHFTGSFGADGTSRDCVTMSTCNFFLSSSVMSRYPSSKRIVNRDFHLF